MDQRRFSTADVLAAGVLKLPNPTTAIPKDRETLDVADESERYVGNGAVEAALDEGKVVTASHYYGIPFAWKAGEGAYRGTLLQYRVVTEDEVFKSAQAAAEWFEEMFSATYG